MYNPQKKPIIKHYQNEELNPISGILGSLLDRFNFFGLGRRVLIPLPPG